MKIACSKSVELALKQFRCSVCQIILATTFPKNENFRNLVIMNVSNESNPEHGQRNRMLYVDRNASGEDKNIFFIS